MSEASDFVPLRRADLIGQLANRLCGKPPDYTAGPPLVEAVRELIGDDCADALQGKLVAALAQIPVIEKSNPRDLQNAQRRVYQHVKAACAPYLFDLTSACTIFARLAELAAKPAKPLETRSAQVDAVMVPVYQNCELGDRVRMPDGRSGVIVTPRGEDGRAGVIPTDNSDPMSADDEGDAPPMDPDAGFGPM